MCFEKPCSRDARRKPIMVPKSYNKSPDGNASCLGDICETAKLNGHSHTQKPSFTLMMPCCMVSSCQSCLLLAYKHVFSDEHRNREGMGPGTRKSAMRYPTLLADEASTAITQAGLRHAAVHCCQRTEGLLWTILHKPLFASAFTLMEARSAGQSDEF